MAASLCARRAGSHPSKRAAAGCCRLLLPPQLAALQAGERGALHRRRAAALRVHAQVALVPVGRQRTGGRD